MTQQDKTRISLKESRPIIATLLAVGAAAFLGWSCAVVFDITHRPGLASGFAAATTLVLLFRYLENELAAKRATSHTSSAMQEEIDKYVAKWAKVIGFGGVLPFIVAIAGLIAFLPDFITEKATERVEQSTNKTVEAAKRDFEKMQSKYDVILQKYSEDVVSKTSRLEGEMTAAQRIFKAQLDSMLQRVQSAELTVSEIEKLSSKLEEQKKTDPEFKKLIETVVNLPKDVQTFGPEVNKLRADVDKLLPLLGQPQIKAFCYYVPNEPLHSAFNISDVTPRGEFLNFKFKQSPGKNYVVLASGQGPQKIAVGDTKPMDFDIRDVGPQDRRVFVLVLGGE